MDKILKRDDYINEIYTPLMEQKEYDELISINEGLLKTLFGVAKNLFKKDWDTISGNPNIISIYRDIDNRLSGYSIMKLSKKDECNQIRQELVDFACDWYDFKMEKAKEKDTDPEPAKSMKFVNDTLKDNLESVDRKIKDIAGEDGQMLKWANRLKEDMRTVINRSILDEIKDEKKKQELKQKIDAQMEQIKKANKIMEKFQNEQLTKIQKERNRLISNTKSTPIKDDILGDKAVLNICGEFNKIRKARENKKNSSNLFKNDELLGFKCIFTDENYGTSEFKTAYKLMDIFYTNLNKNVESFKNTPSSAVQAMCIAMNAFIKNCVFGGQDYGEPLKLMTKCAIVSNGVVGYNLPLNGKRGKNAGNYFTDEIGKLITSQSPYNKDTKGEELTLPKDFNNNAKALFNKIKVESEKLKKDFDKKYNDELKRLEEQDNKKGE